MRNSGPPKMLEATVAFLVPPACREEVVGDLCERYRSLGQYILDAVQTIPFVIVSRIRRTADPQMLVMQAFTFYLGLLGAAWLKGRTFVGDESGLLRLVIPVGIALLGLVLDDAYAQAGQRSPMALARGPVLGLGLALVSQAFFRAIDADLAVPGPIMLYGCALALPLSSLIRTLIPPVTDQLHQANIPADWLKLSGDWRGSSRAGLIAVAVVIAIIIIGTALVRR